MKTINRLFGIFFTIIIAVTAPSVIAAEKSTYGEVTDKCTYPKQPNIPNGKKADMDEMLAAQKNIKDYQTRAQEFRGCIDNLVDAWKSQGLEDDELKLKIESATTIYNNSVSDEEQVAQMFNGAIRAFKSKK